MCSLIMACEYPICIFSYIFISVSISFCLFCHSKLHAQMLTVLALVECIFNTYHFLVFLGFFLFGFPGIILTFQILTLFVLIPTGALSAFFNVGCKLPDVSFPSLQSTSLKWANWLSPWIFSPKKQNLKSTTQQGLWHTYYSCIFCPLHHWE